MMSTSATFTMFSLNEAMNAVPNSTASSAFVFTLFLMGVPPAAWVLPSAGPPCPAAAVSFSKSRVIYLLRFLIVPTAALSA